MGDPLTQSDIAAALSFSLVTVTNNNRESEVRFSPHMATPKKMTKSNFFLGTFPKLQDKIVMHVFDL